MPRWEKFTGPIEISRQDRDDAFQSHLLKTLNCLILTQHPHIKDMLCPLLKGFHVHYDP